jgi:F420-dependent oxidoreductase-like protein
MKIGLSLTQFSWPVPTDELGPRIATIARFAEDHDFDSLWVMDHFFQIRVTGEPPESPMPEAYSTLGFLAGQTSRIQLGTSVTSVAYRHPGVLIKTATTVDVLSGGRTTFGIGAGAPWNRLPPGVDPRDVETVGLGIPMPSLAERFERLEEVLQIARQMWDDHEDPFEGRHYHLGRTLNSPNSLQRPHPPIMIGGGGEQKTLRLVAQYGDACNLFDLAGTGFTSDLGAKLDVLRRHCDEVGRDYGEIEKTCSSLVDLSSDPAGAAASLLVHLRELNDLGFDHVLVGPRQPWDDAGLEAVAGIIDEAHTLVPAAA